MNASAIVMLLVGCTVLYGGLALCVGIALEHEALKKRASRRKH
ncbi:MAG: MetS family NSS transporter small subunit [Candidatus Omnitrophica bacterium]|nr:MetS family NSS transporter small subunit [Candidatus Omnitrophota bacterium]